MQSKKNCSHFQNIKKEQISNQIKGNLQICHQATKLKCTQEEEKWLCLLCGFLGCGRNSDNQCSLEHNKSSKHNLAISVSSYTIWCYACDDDFETLLDECTNEANKQKMENFSSSIKQLLFQKLKNSSTKQEISQIIQKQTQPQQITQSKGVQPLNYTPKQIFGLKNLGNTCFFNSVIQCMNGAKALNDYYLNIKEFNFQGNPNQQQEDENNDDGWSTVPQKQSRNKQKSQQSSRPTVNSIYQNFLFQSQKMKGNTYDPQELFKSVSAVFGRFRTMAQQDAQELLRCFLDGLSTGEEKFPKGQINKTQTTGKPKRTIVENVFGSYLCNYLECLDCGNVSRTFDFCLDFVVQIRKPKQLQMKQILNEYEEIPELQLKDTVVPYLNNQILVQKNTMPKPLKNQNLAIEDCLEAFTEFEELNQQRNYFKCEQCAKSGKKSVKALRKFYFYDLPNIVTIVLKRFQQKSAGRFEKVSEQVEIKEILDLSDYTLLKGEAKYTVQEIVEQNENKQLYKLFGVVVHQGTMQGGHYISYVKHREGEDDHWFYFSDSNFKEVSLKYVLNSQAYILFYEKM